MKLFRTKTNQLSLKVSDFKLLSKSIRPLPNIKEKDGKLFFAFEDKENRYRYRHLDLIVNPKNKNIFINRSKIIFKIRKILNKKYKSRLNCIILPFDALKEALKNDLWTK